MTNFRHFSKLWLKSQNGFRQATALTRKAKMPEPWPYSIYFTVNDRHREVKIIAVWHGVRNPAELRRRLK